MTDRLGSTGTHSPRLDRVVSGPHAVVTLLLAALLSLAGPVWAASPVHEVRCPEEANKEIVVGPDVTEVTLQIVGCSCWETAEGAKVNLRNFFMTLMANPEPPLTIKMRAAIEIADAEMLGGMRGTLVGIGLPRSTSGFWRPVKIFKEYCYTEEQLLAYAESLDTLVEATRDD